MVLPEGDDDAWGGDDVPNLMVVTDTKTMSMTVHPQYRTNTYTAYTCSDGRQDDAHVASIKARDIESQFAH